MQPGATPVCMMTLRTDLPRGHVNRTNTEPTAPYLACSWACKYTIPLSTNGLKTSGNPWSAESVRHSREVAIATKITVVRYVCMRTIFWECGRLGEGMELGYTEHLWLWQGVLQ